MANIAGKGRISVRTNIPDGYYEGNDRVPIPDGYYEGGESTPLPEDVAAVYVGLQIAFGVNAPKEFNVEYIVGLTGEDLGKSLLLPT
jgi:hypothetical protein